MSSFRFKIAEPLSLERRLQDRRILQEEEAAHSGRAWKRYVAVPVLLMALSLLVWKWRYVVYGPAYLARAHWADHSDLYLGKTNGISNRSLVDQARNYLTDIDHVDASGNITAPEALRLQGVHLDMAWFRKHTPDRVDFNPFMAEGGRFVVTWLYYPGCQKTVWKSPRTDTDWYSLRGRPCFPVCRLSIVMDSTLKLTTFALNPS